MTTETGMGAKGEILLQMRGLKIEGQADDQWHEIVHGIDLDLRRGEGLWWVITREVLPNAMPPLVAEFGLRFCFVFLFLSALSFLGLGIQPPAADWGSMVRDNATLITFGDITPLLPAGAIALLTVGVNFVVDWFLHQTSGLRDDH